MISHRPPRTRPWPPDVRPVLLHATLHRAYALCRGGWLSGW